MTTASSGADTQYAFQLWTPFPGLRMRATDLGGGRYGVEIWQQADCGLWAYVVHRPDNSWVFTAYCSSHATTWLPELIRAAATGGAAVTTQASGTDLHARIRKELQELIRRAEAAIPLWDVGRLPLTEEEEAHIVLNGPHSTIRRAEAGLRTLDLHAAVLEDVEWPHDQTGQGKALVCASCHPADPTEWHPAEGEAGVLPEGFVPRYVLAPCPTARELADGEGIQP